MVALRQDFERNGPYHLVTVSCGMACMDAELPDLARAASQAGAKIVVIGGIHKMSTLVQWARVEAIDVDAKRLVLDRLFTFRGDTEQAWDRAEAFIFREISTALAAPAGAPTPAFATAAPEPIALAVFDFELEDFSAGASSSGPTPADTAQLAKVSSEVRQLLAQSGQYRLIDVGTANQAGSTAHPLYDCNGCDAAIALKLGAVQSFVGVVSRISRTEYTIKLQIHAARTGAVVASEDSGLRLGADYSWSRGAVRLVQGSCAENAGWALAAGSRREP